MGYIYCITNTINNKKYVGKTLMSIEKRFSEHIQDSKKRKLEKRPLYNAMNKYGANKFTIELLEEVSDDSKLSDREVYWIEKLGTYGHDGYNATRGGDGKQYYDYEEITKLIKLGYSREEIKESIGCCSDIISRVAKNNQLKIKQSFTKLVGRFTKDGVLLDIHFSTGSAAKFLIKNSIVPKTKANKIHNIRSRVGDCCNNRRDSYLGFVWKYLPNLDKLDTSIPYICEE